MKKVVGLLLTGCVVAAAVGTYVVLHGGRGSDAPIDIQSIANEAARATAAQPSSKAKPQPKPSHPACAGVRSYSGMSCRLAQEFVKTYATGDPNTPVYWHGTDGSQAGVPFRCRDDGSVVTCVEGGVRVSIDSAAVVAARAQQEADQAQQQAAATRKAFCENAWREWRAQAAYASENYLPSPPNRPDTYGCGPGT